MQFESKLNSLCHLILQANLQVGDFAVDCTCGNGYDCAFMAKLVGNQGQVLAIDIQKQAVHNTTELLKSQGLSKQVQVILGSHSDLSQYLGSKQAKAVVFNLGFLPKSNKEIITQKESTLAALQQSLEHLCKGGLIIIHTYTGHLGALEESECIIEFSQNLDYKKYEVLLTTEQNKSKNHEYLIVIYSKN